MRFTELEKPEIGDILEVEIGDEIVETVIVGITESGDYLCETDSDSGMSLLESRSDWDSNMPGYQGDYGGAENWGRRNKAEDENEKIDAQLRAQNAQRAEYTQSGKFWLKYKDSGKHISDQPYTGKAAANAAALLMIRSTPEVKGNLLITAYGPGESAGMSEGMSRAAKGHEKYGHKGMKELAAAGRDGADEAELDKIRDKHDKYDESIEEGKYDRDDYYNARQGREYGKDLTATDYGGGGSGTRRNDAFKDQSKNLPADPFARTTGAVPKSRTGRVHQIALPDEMEEGYTVTPGIDRERYQARDGLEGPFSTKSGKVVYYDKVEGKYYDPDTDMYIEYSDWQAMNEAEYQGRNVPLGKPMQGDVAKSKVYVKNPQGNVVKVNFGDKNMRIKKSNPGNRKSFRARHNCDNPGPRHKARYWSCRAW